MRSVETTYYRQTASLQDNPKTEYQQLKLAKFLVEEWDFYSVLIPIIFTFRYVDNRENQRRGRVGRISGFRQGTRNLNYIPASQHPLTRRNDFKTRRYYDFGRLGWRSFALRANPQITISAFWSESKQRFVDTPQEALFDIVPDLIPQVEEREAERSRQATRSRRQRQNQIERERRRLERANRN